MIAIVAHQKLSDFAYEAGTDLQAHTTAAYHSEDRPAVRLSGYLETRTYDDLQQMTHFYVVAMARAGDEIRVIKLWVGSAFAYQKQRLAELKTHLDEEMKTTQLMLEQRELSVLPGRYVWSGSSLDDVPYVDCLAGVRL